MNSKLDSAPTKIDTILVVDDSPDNVLLVQTLLEEEGYHIETANNGHSAIAQIEASPPDLLLLDVMMPGMDGYEVTRRIRSNSDLPFIPILLITAHDQPSVVQGLDMGADDFIRKPVELDELLARVRSLLRLKHSVDERDEIARQLKRSIRERDAIARQREDFVSRLTHDLRTPLFAAAKMLNLLQQGALGSISPQMQEVLGTMARSNQNLLNLVNTLLEVYRYEAGRKTLNFFPVDLHELIEEVAKELLPLADSKNLALHLKLEPKLDNSAEQSTTFVKGDRLELHRLITNLVGNAINYTDEGSIEIRLQIEATPPAHLIGNPIKKTWIKLEVEDTGQGISKEDLTRLFEKFRQGSHKRAGSGLGLHLSRAIVEAHQGKIGVKSELGKGSTFTVLLPGYAQG